MKKEKIGFIGLGNMGRPMAENLLRAGYELCVFDLREEPLVALAAQGALKMASTRRGGRK